MNQEKPSILAVAPYEGLGELFSQNRRCQTDAQIMVVVGDWDAGLNEAKKAIAKQSYDVVVSRGGTAELLREKLPIPVLDIEITANDILHAVRLADAYNGKSAFVGFEAITKIASLLCQLLDYNMPVYTVHSPPEVDGILRQLAQEGYSLVLCDVVVSLKAARHGLTPVLITSTEASVDKILEEAISIARPVSRIKAQLQMNDRLIANSPVYTMVIGPQDQVLFSSLPQQLQTQLKISALPKPDAGEPRQKFSKQLGDRMCVLETCLDPALPDCTLVYIHAGEDTSTVADGFLKSYSGRRRLMDSFMNQPLYASISPTSYLDALFEQITGFKPVLITGEDSAFQDVLAGALFSQFRMESDIFSVVDLSLAGSGQIDWLLTSQESPLRGSNATVYLKNSQFLTSGQISRIGTLLQSTGFMKNNWLLLSVTSSAAGAQIANGLAAELIAAPALRQCRDILHNLALVCINQFNARYSKQVISLSPEAGQLVENYPWPGNYPQFLRVMEALVIQEQGMYIQADRVRSALSDEAQLYPVAPAPKNEANIDLNRPLDDIITEIIQRTVESQGGNQKKAADILCISRTTVWRMLKKENAPGQNNG